MTENMYADGPKVMIKAFLKNLYQIRKKKKQKKQQKVVDSGILAVPMKFNNRVEREGGTLLSMRGTQFLLSNCIVCLFIEALAGAHSVHL